MKRKYQLAATEYEIMEVLWEKGDYILTRDLLDIFNEKGKNWKRQTLNTLLVRLEEKQLVLRKRAFVATSCTKAEYLHLYTKEILDTMYGGKLGNFCAALSGNDHIEESDAEELNKLIEELSNK
ncbi:MAG: BlaI/MecI/CopY family transcriptional regulator [Lachnospiraceae bacterium]|nr:BlaI/MecI/CopY family transcriptional regulator [Lachnospiraceae bacterium]